MKFLVVLCAVAAVCAAKPSYVAYAPAYAPAPAPATSYSYSTSVVSVSKPAVAAYYAPAAPVVHAAPAPVAYAAPAPAVVAAPAPAPVAYAAPAPVAYAAPAVVAAPAPAPAPVAYAAPAVVAAPAPAPVAYAAPAPAVVAAPAALKTQYHAQNEHGEASYGHSEPGQTHNAVQDAHGNKIGSFSYVNPEGHVLRTDYVADGAGYRVASNALPAAPIVAPVDTIEVAAAKANFYHQYAAKAAPLHRRRRSAVLVQTPASTAPLPAPVAYAAPLAYAAPAVAPVAPVSYAAPFPYAAAPVAPLSYAAPYAAPYSYAAAPAVRPAVLTTVVNNPGHAVSYRVD